LILIKALPVLNYVVAASSAAMCMGQRLTIDSKTF
jgi:hypothetical protein